MDSWIGEIDSNKYVGALLLDLSKAFDSVPHHILLAELALVGCDLKSLDWFISYLSNRQQRIFCRPEATAWKAVDKGVPQGSCLSPLLFNIFTRKLPACTETDSIQFADDVTFSAADADPLSVAAKLSVTYNDVKLYCTNKGLTIHAAKTQFILFKTPGKKIPPDCELNLDGVIIKPIHLVKLLGVQFCQCERIH